MLRLRLEQGQGFGNQLWNIFSVQGIAERTGHEFQITGLQNLKCSEFSNLEVESGPQSPMFDDTNFHSLLEPQKFHPVTGENITNHWRLPETSVFESYQITGLLQSHEHLPILEIIREQLDCSAPIFDGCTISFRGGEYAGIPGVFLPKKYYFDSIDQMRMRFGGDLKFRVVTDDAKRAKKLFPDFEVLSSGGVKRVPGVPYFHPKSRKVWSDFCHIQSSRYQILSNSSFSWWATYSSKHSLFAIAPKYWAAFNTSNGYWSLGSSLTPGWHWMGKDGVLNDYSRSELQLAHFRSINTWA